MTSGRSSRVRWGQNFLTDKHVAEAIVEWAAIDGRNVLEIGPGRGALTEMLAARASSLTLVEIDPLLAESWRERFAGDARVRVIAADFLSLDAAELAAGPATVVSNLPYESGTAIVQRLLEHRPVFESIVVMLQREVCDRIRAAHGSKAYGLLAIHSQLRADIERGRVVKPGSFTPAPKVESQVLRLTPLPALRHPVGDETMFGEMVQSAFASRRKMIGNTLGAWLEARLGGEAAAQALQAASIERSMRPESVPLERFASLAADVYRRLSE